MFCKDTIGIRNERYESPERYLQILKNPFQCQYNSYHNRISEKS